MKILVVGSGGQLGRELKKLHSTEDVHSWIFANRDQLDLQEADDLKRLDEWKPDMVVNCAAYTQVDKAEEEVYTCWEINALGAGRLAKKCNEMGSWLIHVSSDYVYHHNPGRPIKEEDPLFPRGIYAASKAGGEVLVRQFNSKHIVIRTSWLYGNDGPNFVKTMIRLGESKNEIKVVADQWGSPTYTYDLAKAIRKIIRTLADSPHADYAGTYHYVNEGIISWHGFAREIMQEMGYDTKVVPITSEEYPAAAPRPGWSSLSLSKIKRVFDIFPPHWRISLQSYLQELKKQGDSQAH